MHNRIAIFGLTGDPFTVAHREICRIAMRELPIDRLYVIPTVVSYHRQGKAKCLCDFEKLLCMKHMLWSLGSEYLGKWEIDEHEIDLKGLCSDNAALYDDIILPRRFLNTLLDFRCRVGIDYLTTMILGTDEAENFKKWYRYKDVLSNIDGMSIVEGRDGEGIDIIHKMEKEGIDVIPLMLRDKELCKVSASKVRSTFKEGRYDHKLYCEQVAAYDRGEKSLEELGWI